MNNQDETSTIEKILADIKNISVVISPIARKEQLKAFLLQDPHKEKFKVIFDVLNEIDNNEKSAHISSRPDGNGFEFKDNIRYSREGTICFVKIRVCYCIINNTKTISHFYINPPHQTHFLH